MTCADLIGESLGLIGARHSLLAKAFGNRLTAEDQKSRNKRLRVYVVRKI
jgi:hypothetical protein